MLKFVAINAISVKGFVREEKVMKWNVIKLSVARYFMDAPKTHTEKGCRRLKEGKISKNELKEGQ